MRKNTLTLHFQECNCLEKAPSVWTRDVLVLLCLCLAQSSKPVMIYSLQVEQSMSFIESAFFVLLVEAGYF